MRAPQQKAKGFTLVELIIVIVLLGVVATFTSQFIAMGAQIYREGNLRAEQVSQARFLVLRLEKELRNAVPNSIAINTLAGVTCLSYFPIKNSGSYVGTIEQNPLTVVNFDDNVAVDDQVVVYPTSPSSISTNSADNISITAITNTSGNQYQWTLSEKPAQSSPGQRYYVFESQVQICNAQQSGRDVLTRTQDGQTTLLAVDVTQWNPTYSPGVQNRKALVRLALNLQSVVAEPLNLTHEVHIPNVP